jgi:hypothetical protein
MGPRDPSAWPSSVGGVPLLAPVWLLLAFGLSLTRAMLTAHSWPMSWSGRPSGCATVRRFSWCSRHLARLALTPRPNTGTSGCPNAWISYATLVALEIVLGIDNIVFIAIVRA